MSASSKSLNRSTIAQRASDAQALAAEVVFSLLESFRHEGVLGNAALSLSRAHGRHWGGIRRGSGSLADEERADRFVRLLELVLLHQLGQVPLRLDQQRCGRVRDGPRRKLCARIWCTAAFLSSRMRQAIIPSCATAPAPIIPIAT